MSQLLIAGRWVWRGGVVLGWFAQHYMTAVGWQTELFKNYNFFSSTASWTVGLNVGCPRNNQIFFPVRTKTNRNSICFGCFSVCFAKPKNFFFGLFRCFGPVSKQPKQTELCRNKRKKSQKTFSIRGPQNSTFFFSVPTKKNLFRLFSVCFLRNQQICFGLFQFVSVCFGLFRCFGLVSKQPKHTELLIWGIKGDILINLLLFRLVFCLFWLFRNTETPCFDIKAKQGKLTPCLV